MYKLGRISETEMEVMQTIWEVAAPVTVAQLLAMFEESKGWKTSTLSTLLARLMDKGFLVKNTSGKANVYAPTLSWEEYQKYEAQNLLNKLYGGNVKSFVAALVDDNGVSQDDIKELMQWFKDKAGDVGE